MERTLTYVGLDRLHLACGDRRLPGFLNVDIRRTAATDLVADCCDIEVFRGQRFSTVYANAFFEHLRIGQRVSCLQAIYRVLRPTGTVVFTGIPDFERIARAYLGREPAITPEFGVVFDLNQVYRYTHGAPELVPGWWTEQLHKCLFDKDTLEDLLHAAGFSTYCIFRYCFQNETIPLNLGFIAFKQRPNTEISLDFLRALLQHYTNDVNYDTIDILSVTMAPATATPSEIASVAGIPVSIVIPTFNNLPMTQRCLEAIQRNTRQGQYEVIVVDNNSTDGTQEFLRSKETEGCVQAVLNNENLGFVTACNMGANLARGRYLLFLNNDTEPQPGWLEALVSAADRDQSVGAVGAKLVYPNGSLQEAGGIVFSDASGWNYGRGGDPSDPRFNFLREVDYCSGACLLVRSDLFAEIGGFDIRFAPAYYEDTDLCFAIRHLGFKVIYQPAATVIHHEGATAGTDLAAGFKRFQVTNRTKFQEKWASALRMQHPSQGPLLRWASNRAPGMRILVVDPLLPIYDQASGSLRLFQMLKIMAQSGHSVTFISRGNVENAERYISELQQMGIEVLGPDPEKLALLGHISQAQPIDLRSLLLDTKYDLAVLSFFEIAEQYLDDIRRLSPATRIYVDTVDVHFLREMRQAELYRDGSLMRRAAFTKRRELSVYARADALIAVTEEERRHLLSELPGAKVHVVPNIHEVGWDCPSWGERKGLLFVGNFRHPPNIDAILYFCREVFPIVKTELPDATLTIVGSAPPPEVMALAGDGIIVTGYVPETGPYLKSHRVSVAPLRYGAGLKGKVGEALSAGLPVVTTSIGSEGMGLPEERQVLLVADKPADFAAAAIRLYRDEDLWNELSEGGRTHIAATYSPTVVGRQLAEALRCGSRDDFPLRSQCPSPAGRGTPHGNRPSIAAVYCVYDDDSWLHTSLESVYSECDAIYFLISDRPWHGSPSDSGVLRTIDRISAFPDPARKLRIVRGSWGNEASQRNAGLEILRQIGITYCLVIDGDEVYDAGQLGRMISIAAENPDVDCWHVHLDTYWKSYRYRIHPREPSRPAALIKVGSVRFSKYRTTEGGIHEDIPLDIGICHHLSYARDDEQLLRKISTFSHAEELERGWYETVWLAWDHNQDLTNLNPLHPSDYQRAVLQPFSALPPVLQRFALNSLPGTLATSKPLTSIIILVHNQWEQTETCLKSIALFTAGPIEVIVVDNGSTDETHDRLMELLKTWPHLRVITNKQNRGFAAGNNQGLAIARGQYVLLLNNDTAVTQHWLTRMLQLFERDPKAGLVGPMSNYVSGPQLVPSVMYHNWAELQSFASLWGLEHSGQVIRTKRVVGFCLLARREVIEAVGGLDERFGSGNYEDDDFCIRASLVGFRAYIARDAFVHHQGSQTFKGARIDWHGSMQRNWESFKAKWRIPGDAPAEEGYRIPVELPQGQSACLPLPALVADYHVDDTGRHWCETTRPTLIIRATGGRCRDDSWASLASTVRNVAVLSIPSAERHAARSQSCDPRLPKGWSIQSVEPNAARAINQSLSDLGSAPLVLVSDDVILPGGWLESLVAVFHRDPTTAVVGPTSDQAPAHQRIKARQKGTEKGFTQLARSLARKHAGQHSTVPYLGAFCLVFNARICQQVGPLREDMDFHASLWDFFTRVREAGLHISVALDVYVRHHELTVEEGSTFPLTDAAATSGPSPVPGEDPTSGEFDSSKEVRENRTKGTAAASLESTTSGRWASRASERGSSGSQEALAGTTPSIENGSNEELAELEQLVATLLAPGQAALEQGHLPQAAQEFGQVVQQYPDLAAGHAALASTLMSLGRIREAVSSLERAIELAPSASPLHNQLGIARYQLSDLEGAEAAFQQAHQTDGEDLQPLLNLIDLYRGQDQYQEATSSLKEAMLIDPSNPEVLAALGALSLELGDPEGANMAVHRLAAVQPDHPEIASLREALSALSGIATGRVQ